MHDPYAANTAANEHSGCLQPGSFSNRIRLMFSLQGKFALITGAGRGIGLAMAKALSATGAVIALQDIELDVAQREADAINADGGRAVAFGGDVLDLTLPARLVADVLQQLGGLHILINNAAIQQRTKWLEVTAEQLETNYRANVVSPLVFIQQVTPIFQAQQFGRIINMGSIQQKSANPGMFPYSISKGALEKITTGLSRELAKDKITVNQIAPGWITNTHRNRNDFTDPQQVIDAGRKAIPLGRLGEPTDMAGLAVLLCSDAGEYITGQNIFVDGGMVL
jgi:NAD(P)-dependent dehydrogenase (short-subunit alcohol dehydrogenase family)